MITITILQKSGFFLCNSVTVEFGDDVWQRAWVQQSSGQYETSVLVYSYFNGVYKRDGVYAGRPVYTEMRKSDFEPYETKIGASIFYCPDEGAFVFAHQNISKAKPSGEVSIFEMVCSHYICFPHKALTQTYLTLAEEDHVPELASQVSLNEII